MNICWGGI